MPRFYLPVDQCKEATFFLTGREAHHASRVLRLRIGDTVTVLNGAGSEFRCTVEAFDRDKVKLGVREAISAPARRWQITLLQALPKGKIIESIIQKATELGAFRIVPLLSERVVATSIGKKEAQAKTEKWHLIAVEAIKQCGSPWLPQIDSPATPKEFLARSEQFELPLIASLRQGARHAREYFRSFQTEHGRMPATVCVWVGPEGDFSPGEIDLIRSKGALPISLGPLVLRSETAATYCLSILSYELQSTTGLD